MLAKAALTSSDGIQPERSTSALETVLNRDESGSGPGKRRNPGGELEPLRGAWDNVPSRGETNTSSVYVSNGTSVPVSVSFSYLCT